ncbi:MAG: HAMP domain-containing protein [Verrucomicrobiales bacterium]|nr:HAMP domain-containing protein [Verrucomicrobiales bacterium]
MGRLRNLPFRFRIALLSAAISGAVLFGFGIAAGLWLRHERFAALDREIRALAYRHPGWMNNQANYERLGNAIEFIFGDEKKGQLILATLTTQGAVRFKSAAWPPDLNPATLDLELEDERHTAAGAPAVVSTSTPATSAPSPAESSIATRHATSESEGGPPRRGWGFGPGPGPGHGANRGRSAGLAEGLFTKIPRFITMPTAKTTWRLGILGDAEDRLVIGLDCAEMREEMRRMLWGFGFTLPAALGLIGAGGWWVAGRALRPLRRVADAAERVTARGLDQRLPQSTEDPEIQRLIAVLNRMMDRLESSFRQATRFSADASHELKTPLAVMQAELEQALQHSAAGSQEQQTFASLLEETQRLKTITRSLLLLSQADSGQMPLSPAPVDLSAEMDVLLADAQVLAEAAGLSLESQILPGARTLADRVLLRLALSNLVENAIHYNEPSGKVRVTLQSTGSRLELEIRNTGPGIRTEDQAHVFDRFHRGAEARHRRRDGLGLGLSLAREIILAHHGDVVLLRSAPGETAFRVTLPAGPQNT